MKPLLKLWKNIFHKVNLKSTIEGYNSVGKYQLDMNLIDEFVEMRGYWTIAAYLNSFGYLSSEHIEKRIVKTIQVLDYLQLLESPNLKD